MLQYKIMVNTTQAFFGGEGEGGTSTLKQTLQVLPDHNSCNWTYAMYSLYSKLYIIYIYAQFIFRLVVCVYIIETLKRSITRDLLVSTPNRKIQKKLDSNGITFYALTKSKKNHLSYSKKRGYLYSPTLDTPLVKCLWGGIYITRWWLMGSPAIKNCGIFRSGWGPHPCLKKYF